MPVHVTFNMSWKLCFEEILEKEYIIAPSSPFFVWMALDYTGLNYIFRK